jgi:hypothetical protein
MIKLLIFFLTTVTLSNAIFLDRKNRDNAVKEAKQAAADIHNKNVSSICIYRTGGTYIYIIDQCMDFP